MGHHDYRKGPAQQPAPQRATEQAPVQEQPVERAPVAEEPKRAPPKTVKRRVLSNVFVDGEPRAAGDIIELSEDNATSLGEAVTDNLETPEVENIGARTGGVYEVQGPGSVWLGGRCHERGAKVQLGVEDARAFGQLVKRVA